MTSVEMPDDYQLQCSLLNGTAMIRIQLSGDWTADTRDGTLSYSRAARRFSIGWHPARTSRGARAASARPRS